MKRFGLTGLLAVLAAVVVLLSPAQAQVAGQFYASPAGSGNTCFPQTPCSLATAVVQASMANGTVSCIGGGNYVSSLTLPILVTIDCPGAVLGTIGGPAFILSSGSTQVVILRNLTFEGRSSTAAPFIRVTGGATLIIENCKFQNLGSDNAVAIQFNPTSPGAQLIIRDTVFADNGIAPSSGGGLQVAPSGGSASVVLERVAFNYNVTSMVLSGTVSAIMINSTVSASRNNGIIVGSGATFDVKDSTLVYNVGSAISVTSGGTVRLSNTDIKSNQSGISNSGGQALTYSNNRITANGSTATLTPIQGE